MRIFVIKHLSSTSMCEAFSKQSWLCKVRTTEVIFVEETEVQRRNVNNESYASLLYMLFLSLECSSIPVHLSNSYSYKRNSTYVHSSMKMISKLWLLLYQALCPTHWKPLGLRPEPYPLLYSLLLAHSKCSVSIEYVNKWTTYKQTSWF